MIPQVVQSSTLNSLSFAPPPAKTAQNGMSATQAANIGQLLSQSKASTVHGSGDIKPKLTGASGIEVRSAPKEQPKPIMGPIPSVESIAAASVTAANPQQEKIPVISEEERLKHLVRLPPARHDIEIIDKIEAEAHKPKDPVMVAFRALATKLFFSKSLLINNDRDCQLIDLEMFASPDPFTPADSLLFKAGTFYLHRAMTLENPNTGELEYEFSAGRRKGIYITFGEQGTARACLIRALLTPDGVVEGAANVVEYIKLALNCQDLDTLNAKIQDNQSLKAKAAEHKVTRIWNGPRLSVKLPKQTTPFDYHCQTFMKSFRFTCRPELLKEGKHLLAMQAKIQEVPDCEIITGCKLPIDVLMKWTNSFLAGKSLNIETVMHVPKGRKLTIKEDLVRYGCFQQLDF